MEYELRYFDETMLRFEANKDSNAPDYRIHWVEDASAFVPRVYDDFFQTAREYMTRETRAKVRGMLDFEFSRGPRAGITKRRLRMIERQVRSRSRKLLD